MKERLLANGFNTIDFNDYAGQGYEIAAGSGSLKIYFKEIRGKYTARLDKPNGTHKWLVEKSEAQIWATITQTMEFYDRSWRKVKEYRHGYTYTKLAKDC